MELPIDASSEETILSESELQQQFLLPEPVAEEEQREIQACCGDLASSTEAIANSSTANSDVENCSTEASEVGTTTTTTTTSDEAPGKKLDYCSKLFLFEFRLFSLTAC